MVKRLAFIFMAIVLLSNSQTTLSQNSSTHHYDYVQHTIHTNQIKDFSFDTSWVKTYSNDIKLVLYGSKAPSGGSDFMWSVEVIMNLDTIYRVLFNHPYSRPDFELISEKPIILFFEESSNW